MKVAVFGATGGVGRKVVEQLLAGEDEVTAVVREASRLRMRHPRLRIFAVAGLATPEPLWPALEGADAVISAVGPRRRSDGPVASTATKAILRAMARTAVRRFIALSATPVGPASPEDGFLMRRVMLPVIRIILPDLYIDLARMEGTIELSGMDWTVVRPPRLTDGPAAPGYRSVIGGNVPNGYSISRADVADAMCAALRSPATVDKVVSVAD